MLWFTILRKNGVTEVKRLWKKGDDNIARKSPSAREVFGPFDAPSYPGALSESRAILDAVGFTVNQHGILAIQK